MNKFDSKYRQMLSMLLAFVLTTSAMPLCSRAAIIGQANFARVIVPEQVAVTAKSVRLGDVAEIICNDVNLKSGLAAVDIAEVSAGQLVSVSPSFIAIRLRLAGFRSDQFEVTGGGDCQLELVEPQLLTDREVEEIAMKTFQQALGVPIEDLRVRLTTPFMAGLPTGIRNQENLRVEVAVPVRDRLGQVSTMVRLWKEDELVATRATRFDVLKRQIVAVALVSLQREQPVGSSNIRLESRFVDKAVDEPSPTDLIARVPKRDLRAGELVSLGDLKAVVGEARPVVVNARDTVEVVAIRGRLRVKLRTAQALQSGKIGDMIQFRNLDSSVVRSGRVVGAGQIEIRI